MRQITVSVLLVSLTACGGSNSSPSTPTPTPPPTPQPNNWTISGQVVDSVTGAPVGGATMTFGGVAPVTSNGDGLWEVRGTGSPGDRLALTLEATGYVKRETRVFWNAAGRSDVRLDLMPEQRPPFSISFFREFVRNGFEAPSSLEPVRRWTKTPNFYINTTNPKSGGSLRPSEIDLIQQEIRNAVRQITGGQFEAGAFELGAGPRDRQVDYINVTFVYEPTGDYCGRAFIGANPGEITINYDRCPSACGSFPPETIAHEVGHAMGFWHTNGSTDIMNPFRPSRRCADRVFSPNEQLHAKVAYGRVPGNRDPDVDPSNFAAIQTGDAPLVICQAPAARAR